MRQASRSGLPDAGSKGETALSVSAALAIAKSVLSQHSFRIEGEVSELSDKPGYKAVYFTIKDADASLPCLMWKNRYSASGVDLRVGAKVVVTGKFTIFAAKGRMNFDVSQVTLAGDGDLRAQVARLAQKLAQEGLMDPARKRSIPPYPARIGLVTSPRGAAVHDVLRTLRRRWPQADVLLAGVPVEGKNAPRDLASGIDAVVAGGAQVVLLVRGGGSFEDLMPFNDEGLARSVAACPVPIVTGIGHEPDTSIADMVADVRASTPTAAAEAVSPDADELRAQVQQLDARMNRSLNTRLARSREFLDGIASRTMFKDPLLLFSNDFQMLDVLRDDLERGMRSLVPERSERLDLAEGRLAAAAQGATRDARIQLAESSRHLRGAGARLLTPFESELTLAASRLNDFSPLKTLARGWSIVRDGEGSVVGSVADVAPGDELEIDVKDGAICATVTEVLVPDGPLADPAVQDEQAG